jgi:hypothetical protein
MQSSQDLGRGMSAWPFRSHLAFKKGTKVTISQHLMPLDSSSRLMKALAGLAHDFPPPQENHNAAHPKEIECS